MEFIRVIEKTEIIRTINVVVIFDDKLNINWFIEIEKLDGKFIGVREMMNPELFNSQTPIYRNQIFSLAYKEKEEENKSTPLIPEKTYKEAKEIIELYDLQTVKEKVNKLLPIIEPDMIIEYKDMTGNWYEYTKNLQDNMYFYPNKIRVRHKKTKS